MEIQQGNSTRGIASSFFVEKNKELFTKQKIYSSTASSLISMNERRGIGIFSRMLSAVKWVWNGIYRAVQGLVSKLFCQCLYGEERIEEGEIFKILTHVSELQDEEMACFLLCSLPHSVQQRFREILEEITRKKFSSSQEVARALIRGKITHFMVDIWCMEKTLGELQSLYTQSKYLSPGQILERIPPLVFNELSCEIKEARSITKQSLVEEIEKQRTMCEETMQKAKNMVEKCFMLGLF